jgi:APA family basic amino acid/polyamine antiporter
MLMFREPEKFEGRRLAVDATVAVLAFLYSFWMIYGAGQEYIAQGFLLLMAGIPVYVYLKWHQAKTAKLAALTAGLEAPETAATRSLETAGR